MKSVPDFMQQNLTLQVLIGRLSADQLPIAAAAVAEAAGASTAELCAAAAALAAGTLERPALGKARVIWHLVRHEVLPAAQEVIRSAVHGNGPKANLTFPDRLSAEHSLRRGIMGALRAALVLAPLAKLPAPAPAPGATEEPTAPPAAPEALPTTPTAPAS